MEPREEGQVRESLACEGLTGLGSCLGYGHGAALGTETDWEVGGASLLSAMRKNRESLFQVQVTMELLPFPTCS